MTARRRDRDIRAAVGASAPERSGLPAGSARGCGLAAALQKAPVMSHLARTARALLTLASLAALAAGCNGDETPTPDAAVGLDGDPDGPSFCASCGADEICVQTFDGTCGSIGARCEPRNPACQGNTCSPECMRWHCNGGNEQPFFRCDVATCPVEEPGALHCYGP